MSALGKHDFCANICSRAKIDGGGGSGHPPSPGKASQTSVWLGLRIQKALKQRGKRREQKERAKVAILQEIMKN